MADLRDVVRRLETTVEAQGRTIDRLLAVESGRLPASIVTVGRGEGDTRLYLLGGHTAGPVLNGPHLRSDPSDPALDGDLWIARSNSERYAIVPVSNLSLTPLGGTWTAETDLLVGYDDLLEDLIVLIIRGQVKRPGTDFTFDTTTGPGPFVSLTTAPYAAGMDTTNAASECFILLAWRGVTS